MSVNTIALAKRYIPYVDAAYSQEALTSFLERYNGIIKDSLNGVNKVLVPKYSMTGFGSYSRAGGETTVSPFGYTEGNVELEYEEVSYDVERSASFNVDRYNNEESLNVLWPSMLREFIRMNAAPEIDSARVSKLAQTAITAGNYGSSALTTGAEVVAAIRAGVNHMQNASVSSEWFILMRPEIKGMLDDMNSYESKAVLANFAETHVLPSSRMNSAITLNTGAGGQYGYVVADGSLPVAFLIVAGDCQVTAVRTHIKAWTPDENQLGDSYRLNIRTMYLLPRVFDNKKDGVWVHTIPSV